MPLDILNGGKNQNSKKYLDLKFTHKKTHVEFPSLENFQKAFNNITRIKNQVFKTKFGYTLFTEL